MKLFIRWILLLFVFNVNIIFGKSYDVESIEKIESVGGINSNITFNNGLLYYYKHRSVNGGIYTYNYKTNTESLFINKEDIKITKTIDAAYGKSIHDSVFYKMENTFNGYMHLQISPDDSKLLIITRFYNQDLRLPVKIYLFDLNKNTIKGISDIDQNEERYSYLRADWYSDYKFIFIRYDHVKKQYEVGVYNIGSGETKMIKAPDDVDITLPMAVNDINHKIALGGFDTGENKPVALVYDIRKKRFKKVKNVRSPGIWSPDGKKLYRYKYGFMQIDTEKNQYIQKINFGKNEDELFKQYSRVKDSIRDMVWPEKNTIFYKNREGYLNKIKVK
ncbi:MAG: hypothetical protein ACLFP1_04340 [Candidatus Goldiibacteriota bacterium]